MKRLVTGLALIPWAFGSAAVAAGEIVRELDAAGDRVRVEVHEPSAATGDAVVLAHGFLRGPESLSGHARALAAQGHLALVPGLPSRVDSRANGRFLAALIGRVREGALGYPVERVVLVGFSAGALAAMLAAGSPGVVGFVGLDAFDRPGGAGLDAARALRAPAVLLHAPPAFCNAYNISAPWGAALPRLDRERRIDGASHCDFEWPTDAACTIACGRTHPAAQAAIRDEVREAVRRLLPR